MPVARCPDCQRCFVVENARSFQRTCPYCLRPMEMIASKAMPIGSGTPAPVGSPRRPDEDEFLYRNGMPVAADEQGQRLMAAIAEAAFQRGLAQARREAAPPPAAGAAVDEEARAAPISPPAAACSHGGGQGSGGQESSSLQQLAQLHQRSQEIIERARVACRAAGDVRARTRLAREARQRSRSGSAAERSPKPADLHHPRAA